MAELGSEYQRRIAELTAEFAEQHEHNHRLLDRIDKLIIDRDELATLLRKANEERDIAMHQAKAMARAAESEKKDRIEFRRLWEEAKAEIGRLRAVAVALEHETPEKCPTYYDGCHCAESLEFWMVENERLRASQCSHATGPGNEPCDLVAGTSKQLQLAQQFIWDLYDGPLWDEGLSHEDDCPEDDTCNCVVFRRFEEALKGFKEKKTDGNS